MSVINPVCNRECRGAELYNEKSTFWFCCAGLDIDLRLCAPCSRELRIVSRPHKDCPGMIAMKDTDFHPYLVLVEELCSCCLRTSAPVETVSDDDYLVDFDVYGSFSGSNWKGLR